MKYTSLVELQACLLSQCIIGGQKLVMEPKPNQNKVNNAQTFETNTLGINVSYRILQA